MPDLVTSRIFTDGERGITAAKLNDIVGSSVIQPAFYTAKPSASSLGPTDIMLAVKAGAYVQAPFQTVIDSVSAGINSDAEIWSVRLRSWNSLNNPNFEVDQRTIGVGLTGTTVGSALDRWTKTGNLTFAAAQVPGTGIILPGTNYRISQALLRITLGAQKASLAIGDSMQVLQNIEGPQLRELIGDTHSLSLMVRSSVASVSFSVSLRDNGNGYSLTNLFTTSVTPNNWTVVKAPNLPQWTASGNFPLTPGGVGYSLTICLASGTTFMSPANGTWQSGNFVGAIGMGNFAANAVNSTFDVAFVQHEPGSVCSTFIDKPWFSNYEECLRFYFKTYDYETAIAAITNIGAKTLISMTSATAYGPVQLPKPMAKIPTFSFYNNATGALNSVRDGFGVDHASVAASTPGKNGFTGITFTTATTTAAQVLLHFTSDTGW